MRTKPTDVFGSLETSGKKDNFQLKTYQIILALNLIPCSTFPPGDNRKE